VRRTSRGSAFGNSPKSFQDNSAQPFRDDDGPGIRRSSWRKFLPVPLSRTLLGGDVGTNAHSPLQPGSHPEFLAHPSGRLYGPPCVFLVRKFPSP
jgi:hypothetical protein